MNTTEGPSATAVGGSALSEGLGPKPRDDDSRAANGAAVLPVLYDMDCAPLDGAIVQLLVRFDHNGIEDTNDPTWTIGSHNDGEWNFVGWCWHTDEWARGSGDLLGWLPVGPNAAANRTAAGGSG